MNNPYFEYKTTAETIVKTASSLWLDQDGIVEKEFFIAVCACATKPAFVRNIKGYLMAMAFQTYGEPKNSPQYSAMERLARYANLASLDLIDKELRNALGESLSSRQTSMLDEFLNALGEQN